MTAGLWITGVSLATLIFYFIISWRFRQSFTSIEDFFNYGRKMPKKFFTDSFLATNITFASIFLIISATTYERGNLTLWIIIAWIIGLISFKKVFPRIAEFFDAGHTLHQFLGDRYQSPKLRKTASICTIVAFTGTLGIEFWGIILLLEGLGVSNVIASGLLAILIAIFTAGYTAMGGFKAAVHTDKYQKYIILLLSVGLFFVAFNILNTLPNLSAAYRVSIVKEFFDFENLFSDPIFIIAMLVMFIPFQFSVMDMWQRCTAIPKDARLSAIQSVGSWKTVVMFLFAFSIPVLIGLSAKHINPSLVLQDEMLLLPVFLHEISRTSIFEMVLIAIIYAGFLAALISTADTLLINITYTFMYDILSPWRGVDLNGATNDQIQHSISIFRFWVFMFALLAIPIIFSGLSLYQLVFAVFSSQIVLFVPIIYAIYRKDDALKKANGAINSIVIGFFTAVVSVLAGKLLAVPDLVDGAPVLAFIVSLVVFFSAKKKLTVQESDAKKELADV